MMSTTQDERRNFRTKCVYCGVLNHIYYAQNVPDDYSEMECSECGETGGVQKLTLPPGAKWDER